MEAQLHLEHGATRSDVFVVRAGEKRVLGSGEHADIRLQDDAVAPRHLFVELAEDGLRVVDLGGPGGTRLNGRLLPVGRVVEVDPGDEIALGTHVLRVQVPGLRPRIRGAALFPSGEFADFDPLGVGASGKVFRAIWKPHDIPVALKVLREEVGHGSLEEQRFLREASILSRVESPYVCRLHGARIHEGRWFTILELVEGPSLVALLRRGPLPVPAALRVGEDVARALQAAAAEGIVHRDVKPANILLSRAEQVAKLCDFGLASDSAARVQGLTRTGQGLGTLAYIAPEQLMDAKRADLRADVYSLGATMFHLLTGRPPVRLVDGQPMPLLRGGATPLLSEAEPQLPAELTSLIQAAMARERAHRPPPGVLADGLASLRERHHPAWDPVALYSSPAE